MNRTASLALLSLAAFLLLFPLTLGKPGLPPNLKADEAAYYLMALSLAEDGDLEMRIEDVDRVFQEFPFGPANNLILMTDDGWRTIYFGKPYIFSLLAAPFAALFGANGLVFFNMLLLLGMVWMGALHLSRFNAAGLALLFSAGFFLLSAGFPYVFWLQPELLNMAGVAACLWLGLRVPGEAEGPELPPTRRRELLLAALSGAALVLAVYNKPMLAVVGLPVLAGYARRRRWATAGAWLAGAALCLALVAGIAMLLTGHPTSYLGVRRQGVTVCEPGVMPIRPADTAAAAGVAAAHSPTGNAWSWLFRPPETTPREVAQNVGLFLFGRHTGLLLYLPFAAVAVVLFLVHGRRSLERWLLLGALAAVALFFLVFISFNWHGGGGFIGNRYFINAYPGFLFLVTRVRPRWLVAAGYALGGLFLAPVLFTPFGAGGPEPTLQSHVRNAPFRFFPLELTLRNVPGYERLQLPGDLRLVGRRDQLLPQGEQLWVRGADRAELWLLAPEPIERALFEVTSPAPGNTIELRLGDARQTLAAPQGGETFRVELVASGADRSLSQFGQPFYAHRLVVAPATGRIRHWTRLYPPNPCPYFAQDERTEENFFAGATLTYLGSGEGLDADLYDVEWLGAEVPARVAAGETFTMPVRLRNASGTVWPAAGGARVRLAYHWLAPDGTVVVEEGERTELPGPVAPGRGVRVEQRVVAPAAPGRYVLALDPVFERVAWFSDKNGGKVFRAEVEVVAPHPPAPSPVALPPTGRGGD